LQRVQERSDVTGVYRAQWTLSQTKSGQVMSNQDKMLAICFIGLVFSMSLIAIDAYRVGKERGIREGWHRGRSLSRQEFWEE
jgi:hypothetical protein